VKEVIPVPYLLYPWDHIVGRVSYSERRPSHSSYKPGNATTRNYTECNLMYCLDFLCFG